MRIPNAFSKIVAASVGFLAPVLALAEGESSGASISFTEAEGLAGSMGTALQGFVTGHVIPAVLLIIGAMVSLLLLYRVIRWLLRALAGR